MRVWDKFCDYQSINSNDSGQLERARGSHNEGSREKSDGWKILTSRSLVKISPGVCDIHGTKKWPKWMLLAPISAYTYETNSIFPTETFATKLRQTRRVLRVLRSYLHVVKISPHLSHIWVLGRFLFSLLVQSGCFERAFAAVTLGGNCRRFSRPNILMRTHRKRTNVQPHLEHLKADRQIIFIPGILLLESLHDGKHTTSFHARGCRFFLSGMRFHLKFIKLKLTSADFDLKLLTSKRRSPNVKAKSYKLLL